MKLRKNRIWMIFVLVVVGVNSMSLSKYHARQEFGVNMSVAKMVVDLEKDAVLKAEMKENSFPIEYNFCLNNYKGDKVNEIEFDYVIEVENSVENFPINCQLFDCDAQEEITLVNGKSEKMKIKKLEKESRKFKLILSWRELNQELADNIQIKLKLDVVQSKKGDMV